MQGRVGCKKFKIRKQRLGKLKENQLLVAEGRECIEHIGIISILSVESEKRSIVLTGDKAILIEISLNAGDKKNWTDDWIVNKNG